MFSRSTRFSGVALVSLAAALAMGAPARADDRITSAIQLPRELSLCGPGGGLGLPVVGALLAPATGCGGPAVSVQAEPAPMNALEHRDWLEEAAAADELPPQTRWSIDWTP
ncbi:hypothetical protein [Nonomuraea sp. NPDC050783]|uniref:hypothetical protein n=1 Tax=Nonomuraea sp. NPDC050783 TaxID=3154634 RepID=UPI00346675E0